MENICGCGWAGDAATRSEMRKDHVVICHLEPFFLREDLVTEVLFIFSPAVDERSWTPSFILTDETRWSITLSNCNFSPDHLLANVHIDYLSYGFISIWHLFLFVCFVSDVQLVTAMYIRHRFDWRIETNRLCFRKSGVVQASVAVAGGESKWGSGKGCICIGLQTIHSPPL